MYRAQLQSVKCQVPACNLLSRRHRYAGVGRQAGFHWHLPAAKDLCVVIAVEGVQRETESEVLSRLEDPGFPPCHRHATIGRSVPATCEHLTMAFARCGRAEDHCAASRTRMFNQSASGMPIMSRPPSHPSDRARQPPASWTVMRTQRSVLSRSLAIPSWATGERIYQRNSSRRPSDQLRGGANGPGERHILLFPPRQRLNPPQNSPQSGGHERSSPGPWLDLGRRSQKFYAIERGDPIVIDTRATFQPVEPVTCGPRAAQNTP
jgi:hypothetical protein